MIVQEPFSDYKAKTAYVNPSSFKGEDVYTPKHFLHKKNTVQDETLPMKLGSAFHCAVLTPQLLAPEYAFTNKKQFVAFNESGTVNKANAENKQIIAALQKKHNGKILLMPDEAEMIIGMAKGIKEDIPDIEYVLDRKNSLFETSIYLFAKFSENGNFECLIDLNPEDVKKMTDKERSLLLPIKTRSDYFHNRKGYATDLKSTKCAHPMKFMYDVEKYGYHMQVAMTLDMLNCQFKTTRYNTFWLIAVENHPPYAAIKLNCTNQMISEGQEDYINRLEHIHKSYNANHFKGYEVISQYRTFDNDNNELRNFNTCDIDLPPSYYNRKKYITERYPFMKPF